MANTTTITMRIDENLKSQMEAMFADMGLNMTTAFVLFGKAVLRQGKIPFEIVGDPFWSESNQAHLRRAIEDLEAGRGTIHKTMDELEAMENE